ncbi:MAG: aldehyde dehydrogenase family protein [Candidatus Poseidoniales archaeon]|jgi:aldehyde dehydrogenase (NAD+)|uniref:Aldehyde dehydrogenase n=1 Tax=uncultured Poseidoniia archaeon TaxID=1697135 RepID=A0A0R7K206_9ARCH|nr:aldehyde dehydrogenase [uncultured Candidatus Thalassoarchaea sp.]MAV19146.1 aldehyde dehydrogenase family protein [Euryarchaeota archaeon]MDA7603301.1 aldehyde dehydrogenase family protein [Euryarchaeota archaeon]RCH72730.1 MAG: aldehyde dehydrogenase family protein [Candidatus Poseidoniales archaeon]|tara:strand:+ start:8034 stop:9452 length:1419 start_codon:yes stop_codon:yes gene_type:complete
MHTRDQLYIDGKWVQPIGTGSIDVINPATEEIIGKIPVGSKEDIDIAASAARIAFDSWSKSSIETRIDILNALSNALKERGEDIAQTITAEVGTPIGYSRVAMVGTPRVVSRSYAKILENFDWEEKVRNSIICKEPIGVCAFITPWNFPLHQIIGKVAPAIAAGCTMILKPSKEAPLSAFILADILHEIGLPSGVFNLVSGHGSEIGNYMSSHPEVDMVSFTGSTGAGISVSEAAATTVKRVTLELGGKSANVALEDADPTLVAKKAIGACHQNSGQTCSALTRLIIPESMSDEVYEIIAEKNNSYTVGDPLEESTRCGPMVSLRQQKSVSKYIESGINEGATLISGGLGMPEGISKGYYVKPTIFANVSPDMKIWKEEIFGPVLVITTYKSEEEALKLANDSIYGLSGGVWSKDEKRAIKFAKDMRTGQVSVNGGAFNVSAPFGGYKLSGNGRELGSHGLNEFLEIKSIQL